MKWLHFGQVHEHLADHQTRNECHADCWQSHWPWVGLYICNSLLPETAFLFQEFNPLALKAAKTGLTILMIFSSQKRFYQNYLKKECLPEYYQQLSFKYFARTCFISKLFSKVWKNQMILSWGTLSENELSFFMLAVCANYQQERRCQRQLVCSYFFNIFVLFCILIYSSIVKDQYSFFGLNWACGR